MEQQHEFERLKWEQQMERMQHDFDRERKEWTIHDMQLHARMELMKKEMENHLKSGTRPHHGTSPRHPQDHGPKNEMHRGINQGTLPPHLQHNNKQAPKKSQCQISSEKQPGLKKGCKKNDPASSKGSRKDKCKKECSSKKGK